MGAAAGLIVAATAGLAYLRSPEKAPPLLQELAKPAQAETAAPPAPQATQARAKQMARAASRKETDQPLPVLEAPPPPPPAPAPEPLAAASPAGAPVLARENAARMNVQAAAHQAAEARDQVAKKAEAPKAAAAMLDTVGSAAPVPSPARMKAKTAGAVRPDAAASFVPAWTLELQPDGSMRVLVWAPRGAEVILLRRAATGIEALRLRATGEDGVPTVLWRTEVNLASGDVLDLYLLNTPVADPTRLPETGPVDGFRARIHPAAKKEAPR